MPDDTAVRNDENPYKTSYRQVSVKHMSNIASPYLFYVRDPVLILRS